MSRHLVHSFLLATALSPLVNAGPCRPHTIPSSSLTQDVFSSTVGVSSLNPSDTSQSTTVSEDAVPATETSSILPTDTTLSFSDIYYVSTETSRDVTVSTDPSTDLSSNTMSVTISVAYTGTTSTEISMSSETNVPSSIDTASTLIVATDTTSVLSEEETSTVTISENVPTVEPTETTDTALAETTMTTKETDTTKMSSVDVTITATGSFASTTEASSTAPATSTEAAPACAPTFLYPKPAGAVCGRSGNPESGINHIESRGGGAAEDIYSCYKACQDTPECGSVIFNQNVFCELWKGKPGETNNLESDWRWWDMDCFTCIPDETEPTTPTQPEPTCKNNLVNPPPQYRGCGVMGDGTGLFYSGQGPDGSDKSLLACAKACSVGRCSAFKFEEGIECEFYAGSMSIPDGTTTSYKWYDQDCFCDLEKPDPNEPGDNEDVCVDELPKTTVCAVEGQPKNICIEDITPFAPSSTRSLEACRDLCRDNECDSIAFKKDEWCSIFKGQVGGMSDDIQIPGLKMWDMACFDEGPTGD